MKKLFIILLLSTFVYCNNSKNNDVTQNDIEKTNLNFDILPFEDVPKKLADSICANLKKFFPNVTLLKSKAIPKMAYYKPRNRYRADSILNYLKKITPSNHVTIALTTKDISTTKENVKDYGIMGLGWTPGNSCVVSTFRLSKQSILDQFIKLSLHELGHTSGLPHCENLTCLMRDAEGKNHMNEEKDFCEKCKKFLVQKEYLK